MRRVVALRGDDKQLDEAPRLTGVDDDQGPALVTVHAHRPGLPGPQIVGELLGGDAACSHPCRAVGVGEGRAGAVGPTVTDPVERGVHRAVRLAAAERVDVVVRPGKQPTLCHIRTALQGRRGPAVMTGTERCEQIQEFADL
ncbi:hypothetical protein ACFVW1_21625 [Streptomyces olivochromogenes]|uniref:hypothetical protein n=1 Tax=Streptomyces olivochromogenes TaxID=1963 RepID=UPI0036D8E551